MEAQQCSLEQEKWQARVLKLWNPNITAFDTLRVPHPTQPACNTYKTKGTCPAPRCTFNGTCAPPPPPPPPGPPPPPLGPVAGYKFLPDHNGTFCCDQAPCAGGQSTFLHQGSEAGPACFALCSKNKLCDYVTYHNAAGHWCFNSQYCNKTNPFDGKNPAKPAPAIMANTHTWLKDKTAAAVQEVATAEIGSSAPVALAGVRELASLSSPWYFGAVPKATAAKYAASWNTAFDPEGLGAPYGLRTAEKRNPRYFCDHPRPGKGGGCCNWSGPMWPFESAKAISAAINVLNDYTDVTTVDKGKLWTLLWQYAASHTPLWKVRFLQSFTFEVTAFMCFPLLIVARVVAREGCQHHQRRVLRPERPRL